jgi:hypothetical protein
MCRLGPGMRSRVRHVASEMRSLFSGWCAVKPERRALACRPLVGDDPPQVVTVVTAIPGPTSSERMIVMVVTRCLPLPAYRVPRCWPWLLIGRIVIIVTVLVVAAVFAMRGYPPDEIAGPMLVLVAGAVAAGDRLVSVGPAQPASALPMS